MLELIQNEKKSTLSESLLRTERLALNFFLYLNRHYAETPENEILAAILAMSVTLAKQSGLTKKEFELLTIGAYDRSMLLPDSNTKDSS